MPEGPSPDLPWNVWYDVALAWACVAGLLIARVVHYQMTFAARDLSWFDKRDFITPIVLLAIATGLVVATYRHPPSRFWPRLVGALAPVALITLAAPDFVELVRLATVI